MLPPITSHFLLSAISSTGVSFLFSMKKCNRRNLLVNGFMQLGSRSVDGLVEESSFLWVAVVRSYINDEVERFNREAS